MVAVVAIDAKTSINNFKSVETVAIFHVKLFLFKDLL
jgi:hypothetical protein